MNCRAALIALVLECSAAPAQAHVIIQGLGNFQGGIIHPLLVPEHMLCLISLGLMLGQQRKPHRLLLILTFAAGAVIAIVSIVAALSYETATAILVIAFVCGFLVTVGRPLPLIATASLTLAGAFAIEFDSVPALISATDTLAALAGTALGACLVLIIAAGITVSLRHEWMRIGVRVVGSWSAAVAALVLALQFKK